VDFALATAVEELTEIVLVSVLNPLPFPTGMLEREALVTQRAETDRYLAQIAERVAEQGFPVETESLVHADTATAILEAVESHGADLVSIAAPQRSASDRLFLGSVINQLLRRSHIPMLVWRNRALAGTTLLPPRTAPSVEP
jgi:nucleotide-binding universal stress UspA family protein